MSDISVFQQAPYEWKYGRQNEYTLTLYPMSMADQLKITGVIAAVLKVVGEASKSITDGATGDIDFINAIATVIRDNFIQVAAIVSGKDADNPMLTDLPNHVTNMQFMEFANYVWETNYGAVRKNYSSLFELLAKQTKKEQAPR